MGFDVGSREDLAGEWNTQYQTAFPEKNASRGSDGWRLGRVVSGLLWSVAAKLLSFDKQRLPDTATGSFLQRWGNIYKLPQKAAQGSTGVNALEVAGDVGSPVPVNAELSHADGTLYEVTTVGAVVGAGGTVVVSIDAISTGLATNKNAGDVLQFTDPPTGVDAQATLVADLVDGTDLEADEDYQPRVCLRISDPPQGHAIADYYQAALAVAGVGSAYIYQFRRGLGTIDVAVLANQIVTGPLAQAGPSRIIADLSGVTSAIAAIRPGGVKDIKILTVVPQTQDVTVEIEIDDTTYSWDWDDDGAGFVITAFNSLASTITVPTLPTDVIVGSRMTFNGEEVTVTAIAAGSVLTLAFTPPPTVAGQPPPITPTWFSIDPTPGTSVVRASGDLVWPVRNATIGEFGKLGPARGDGVNNFAATSWVDTLKTSRIDAAAVRDTSGVTDIIVDVPAANVVPIDTFGETVPLLVPGKIIVVKKP